MRGLIALTLVASVAAGIYPDDHWQYASKLANDEEFDALVGQAVDSDKTLFVRWIASEG